jgi:membrane-associated phospholipid phosphatase
MVVPYLIILITCLFIKLTFTRHQIYFAVNGYNGPVMDFFAPFVTDMGNGWTAVAIAAIFSLFSYRKAFIIAIGYAITSLSAQIVKYIFIAPRPKLYFGQEIAHAHFVKGIYILSTYSFPSGHTVSAFTLAVIFSYWSRNKWWCPVFLLLAVMVGYSRMYLSEHFFEDVVAGSVLGFVLTVIWVYWIENRKFIHRPSWQRGLLFKNATAN